MTWWDNFEKLPILIRDIVIDNNQIEEEFTSMADLWMFLKGYLYGRMGKK